MAAAAVQRGAGGDLLDDVGRQRLPHQGVGAVVGTKVEGGHAIGLVIGVGIALEGQGEVGIEGVGDGCAVRHRRVIHVGTGEDGLHAGGDHAALEAGCQIPEDLGFTDRAVGTFDDLTPVGATEPGVDDHAFTRKTRACAAHTFALLDRVGGTAGDAQTQAG